MLRKGVSTRRNGVSKSIGFSFFHRYLIASDTGSKTGATSSTLEAAASGIHQPFQHRTISSSSSTSTSTSIMILLVPYSNRPNVALAAVLASTFPDDDLDFEEDFPTVVGLDSIPANHATEAEGPPPLSI